jgi:hypothetical protein
MRDDAGARDQSAHSTCTTAAPNAAQGTRQTADGASNAADETRRDR